MRELLILFAAVSLFGCTYTDTYVHEETEILNKHDAEQEDIVNVLADRDLVLYPDFTYFRPGYDNPYASLHVISNEPASINIASFTFVNLDTGLRHENVVNEALSLNYSESFRGIRNLERYSGGIRVSDEEVYQNLYGALEIEMTVSYSINDSQNESETFKLRRISVKESIFVQ